MKVLKVEIAGADCLQTQAFLNAIIDVKKNCVGSPNINISYSYKEEDTETISVQVTESTPFSRYLQSTTPEGSTAQPYCGGSGKTICN